MAIGSTSSEAHNPHPTWVRWLLPSVGDLLFAAFLILLAFTALSVRLLGDAGIGWHIRTGQLILATHAIPRADPFSSSTAGQSWFAWEWLYDVIVGWLDRAAGLNGVVLFTALTIALVFSWTFRLLLHRGTNFPLALILVLLAASAAMIHFLARPHVVSWLFTVAWFWILESTERNGCGSDLEKRGRKDEHTGSRRNWPLWLLPLLMVVWVNVHGGFLFGFALLGIYWLSAAWQWFTSKGESFEDVLSAIEAGKRAKELAFMGILSALATFVNPYGWRLHLHIYRYLSNRFLMDHIDEFQSPNFHYIAQKCFAGLLLLTLVALAANRREGSLSQSLVVLFAVFSGLYASRNIPASALLLILAIGPWLSDAMERLADRPVRIRWRPLAFARFLRRMRAIESSLRGHLWPIAAIAFACGIAAHGGKLADTPFMDAHFDDKRFPVEAVSYIEKRDLGVPVLTPDSWGGYLIYRLSPRVKVVVDDRHDLYGQQFLESYLKMMHAEPGWDDFLREHEVQCALVPKNSALANLLTETPSWKKIYEDNVAIAFDRTPNSIGASTVIPQ
jgi:hypothetical protein